MFKSGAKNKNLVPAGLKQGKEFLFRKQELIAFVTIVVFISLVLFLTTDILELAKREEKDVQLTFSYLENLIKIEPDNYEARIILAQKYINHGYFARAEELLEDIARSDVRGLREKVVFLRYNLLKKKTFSFLEGSREREVALRDVERLLGRMMKLADKEPELLTYIYNESISMNLPNMALTVVEKGLTLEDEKRIYWLKEGYKVALMTSTYNKAFEYVKELSNLDIENRGIWLLKAGDIALSTGKYKESSNLYLKALEEENDKKKRRKLIRKAINSLMAGKKLFEATNIIREFYERFIDNADIAIFFIQTALSANDIKLAREISIKVLEVLE